jgi:membrane-bound ClpP family serine protease
MTPTLVILLALIGLVLIAVEIFFVPGSTFVGVIGGLVLIASIVCAFIYLDTTIAWALFAGTTVASVVLGYFAFRPNTWKKIAVNSTIDGKIIDEVQGFQTGLQGITLTPCNPIGKAKFGDKIEEVYSLIDFIDTNTQIKIESVKENKIFVSVIK